VLDEASNTTRRARLLVGFETGDSMNVFVKAPARSWVARAAVALPGLTTAEVGFYRDVGASAPIRVPACHHAEGDWRGFLLVLEDLTSVGARFGALGDSLPPADVAELLTVLARLHGAYWEDPRLASAAWPWCRRLVPSFEAVGGQMAGPLLLRLGVERAGASLPDGLRAPLAHYSWHRSAIRRRLDQAPRTLLHQDCHPGNIARLPEGKVVLCDWQLVRGGPWAADVAYLLATALDVEDRRRQERQLLQLYLDELADAGGRPPAEDEGWRQYVAHLVYPLEAMVITLALGAMQPAERVRQVVARAAAAVGDHGALGEVGRRR
jgi:hypothetical protein